MATKGLTKGRFQGLADYISRLKDPSPYWRLQATAWGIFLVVLVGAGVLFAFLGLSGVFGGGNVSYQAQGSPGPVEFRHYTHMWFKDGKYKDCRTCHDKIFATQKYSTFVMRALQDSPVKKVRIGRDSSTLYVLGSLAQEEVALVTYEVPRACATCATGNCHDGKESFSRLDCLGCHQTR
jgi:hypothetical protein